MIMMTNRTLLLSAAAALLSLSACDNKPSSDSKTTRLDAIEVQPGSVSDAMITLDQVASDGTAIDHSVPADPNKKAETKADTAPPATPSDSSNLATNPGDVVVTPNGPAASN